MSGMTLKRFWKDAGAPIAGVFVTIIAYMSATLLVIAAGRWTGLIPDNATTCICDGKVAP